MTWARLEWKQQSNAILCKEATSAHSVLGSTDKLPPVHEVLQIPLPLWLRHRDAGENRDIKQYLFLYSFIGENCPSAAASQSKCYPLNCSTFWCFSYHLLHRRLNFIISSPQVINLLFFNSFSLYFLEKKKHSVFACFLFKLSRGKKPDWNQVSR